MLFLVTVSRDQQQQFWVDSESKEAAEVDAQHLAEDLDDAEWEITFEHLSVVSEKRIVHRPDPTEVIWRGGADGAWELVGNGSEVQQVRAGSEAGQADRGDNAGEPSASDDSAGERSGD